MRLSVGEDEPRLLHSLNKALRQEATRWDTAANGKDGLYKARTDEYDCI